MPIALALLALIVAGVIAWIGWSIKRTTFTPDEPFGFR